MYIMSDVYMESGQPLNLVQPSKSKAKMMARAVASQWSLRHSDTCCQCPQIDSKSSILYRLLTDSYYTGAPCSCASPHCHNGVPVSPRESKLKILLEESKKQAVQS